MKNSMAYPLIFGFDDSLSTPEGQIVISGVGRALMVREDDGRWWMYGVQPGGLAENGESPQKAHQAFVAAFKGILLDILGDSNSFTDFAERLDKFFNEATESDNTEWQRSLDAIRSGDLVPEPPFDKLPKRPGTTPCCISVEYRPLPEAEFKAEQSSSYRPSMPAAA